MLIRIQQHVTQGWVTLLDLPADELTPEEILSTINTMGETIANAGRLSYFNGEAAIAVVIDTNVGPIRITGLKPKQQPDGNYVYIPLI